MPAILVAQSADDAVQLNTGAVTITTGTIGGASVGNGSNVGPVVGLRFQGVQIAPGAVVVSCFMTLRIGKGDDPRLDMYCQAADSAGAFAASANDLSGRALTTARVDWDADNIGTAVQVNTIELASIVQEVVNRGGWASGNALVFLLYNQSDTSTIDFAAWDDPSLPEPSFTVKSLKPAAGTATVSFVANDPVVSNVPARPDSPTVAFVVNNPTVVTGTMAAAGSASVAFTAFDAGAQTTPAAAAGVFTAFDAQQAIAPTLGTAVVSFAAATPSPGRGVGSAVVAFSTGPGPLANADFRFETPGDVEGWTGYASSIAQSTDVAFAGVGSLKVTCDGGAAAAPYSRYLDSIIPVVPGRTVRGATNVYATVAARYATVNLVWLDASHVELSRSNGADFGAFATLVPGTWVPFEFSGVAPPGAAWLCVQVLYGLAGWAAPPASEVFYIDRVSAFDPVGVERVDIAPTLGTSVVSFTGLAPIPAVFIEPQAPFPTDSARFRRAITESHTIKTVLDLHHLDDPVPFAQLLLIEGGITEDRGDDVPRSVELTVIDEENAMTAQTAETILEPLTKEVHIWNGVVYPDGTEEMKSCGWFPITKYEMVRRGGKRMYRITCYDRGKRAQVDFGRPYSTIAGRSLGSAIRDLLNFKTPMLPVGIPETDFEVPRLIFSATSNPLAEAVKLAKWSGLNLQSNKGTGVMELVGAVTKPALEPRWKMIDNANACAWEVETSMDMDQAPNHVVVKGKGNNVSGEAMDTDTNSPTWVGKIGKRTRTYEDERVTTQAQAVLAAKRILSRDLGTSKVHPLKALPNPALNLDDTVWLRQPDYGIDAYALVDKIELNLTAKDEMSVKLRRGVQSDTDLIGQVLFS